MILMNVGKNPQLIAFDYVTKKRTIIHPGKSMNLDDAQARKLLKNFPQDFKQLKSQNQDKE